MGSIYSIISIIIFSYMLFKDRSFLNFNAHLFFTIKYQLNSKKKKEIGVFHEVKLNYDF